MNDTRDGMTYKIVKIGEQIWMAENLNYNTGNSWCYDNNSSSCNKYGRLYDWETALNACPSGWHLPSEAEFKMLLVKTSAGGGNLQATSWGGLTNMASRFSQPVTTSVKVGCSVILVPVSISGFLRRTIAAAPTA